MASAEEISSGKAGYFPMADPITVSFFNRLNVKELAINATARGSALPAPAGYPGDSVCDCSLDSVCSRYSLSEIIFPRERAAAREIDTRRHPL